MIFNGMDFRPHLKVEEIRRDLLPPIDVISRKVPRKAGSGFIRKELGAGNIEVDIRLIESSREEVQSKARSLAGMLLTEIPKRLRLHDEWDKYNLAILSGNTDLEKLLYTGFTTLIFECNDPLAYGQTKKHVINDNITLIVGGTYEAKPVITVQFTDNQNSFKITHVTSGKYVLINHGFVAGDELEIDFTDKWKARKNGVVIAEDVTIQSDFFDLAPGENKLKIEPAGLKCELEYTERWL